MRDAFSFSISQMASLSADAPDEAVQIIGRQISNRTGLAASAGLANMFMQALVLAFAFNSVQSSVNELPPELVILAEALGTSGRGALYMVEARRPRTTATGCGLPKERGEPLSRYHRRPAGLHGMGAKTRSAKRRKT
jgi:hypothetical protein